VRALLHVAVSAAAVLASLLLVTMVVVMFAAIVLRYFGILVPGHEEIATFAMVGMAFLGLPYAYRTGAHVRVETLLNRLPMSARRPVNIWCIGAALATCLAFAFYAILLAWDSWMFGDVSEGLLAIPRWIPQAPLAIGLVLFALTLLDDLVVLMGRGTASFENLPQDAVGQHE
jgi:TRAP-type C4-dicarboxylate transport system permease small subunit